MTQKRKRGRQPKHWSDHARIDAWYFEVSRRSGLRPAELDRLFAWREGKYEAWAQGRNEDSVYEPRPKTFERIAKEFRKPRGMDPRWRGFAELLDAVDRHPGLEGTKRLYEAEIWKLFQERLIPVDSLEQLIIDLCLRNGLVRLKPEKAISNWQAGWIDQESAKFLDYCLQLSLKEVDLLDGAALTWSLFQEAMAMERYDVVKTMRLAVEECLDRLFQTFTPDGHFVYLHMALGLLTEVRVDLFTATARSRSIFTIAARWPIVPRSVVGSLKWHGDGLG